MNIMKINKMKFKNNSLLITALIVCHSVAYADDTNENFPSSDSNSAFYYQIGGGRDVPIPGVENDNSIPIQVAGDAGLGFSCGKFNPTQTITNSLNDFKDSIQNLDKSIVSNATSAITSFPMYKLAQADPKLYDILNNNVLGAHDQFNVNLKSCEEMQSEALKGEDPYSKWLSVSRNSNMKHMMAFGDGDLNEAMTNVNKDQGDQGVPWSSPGQPFGSPAGGVGQPPILVIHDTAIAGYNVMLGRSPTDSTSPVKSDSNTTLLNYWATPESAAKWIVSVAGDQEITTCSSVDCPKDSTPGIGLLYYVEQTTTDINQKLIQLIQNPDQVNEQSLLAVSAPGQVISESLLNNIRQMNPNVQANTLTTLSQNIATTRIVNEALLAIDLLQTGSQVPNIHVVNPAQTLIAQKIQLLHDDINEIMYSVNIRRELNSNVMSDIMQYNQSQNANAASIPQIGDQPATMEHGGVLKGDQSS